MKFYPEAGGRQENLDDTDTLPAPTRQADRYEVKFEGGRYDTVVRPSQPFGRFDGRPSVETC